MRGAAELQRRTSFPEALIVNRSGLTTNFQLSMPVLLEGPKISEVPTEYLDKWRSRLKKFNTNLKMSCRR